MLQKNIAILVFVLIGISVSAQRYDVKRYSVNEGLPSSQVYDIEFDSLGFAWFATAYGVVRTDGINFKTIGVEQGLKEETITDLFIDSEDNFWVAAIDEGVGLIKEDTVVYLEELNFLNGKDVNYITESSPGKLWFGTNNSGVYILDRTTNNLDSLTRENSALPANTVWDIYFDDSGLIWVSTQRGLAVFDKQLEEKWILNEENGLNGFAAYQAFETSKGDMWIGSTSGVTVVKPDFSTTNISELDGKKLNYVFNINEDDYDHIWIGTERDGVFWYTENESRHITKKNGLSSNFVYRLVKDRNGIIWVATDGDGVTIFKDTQFQIFDSNSEYGANEVYGAYKSKDGTLWFSSPKGLTSLKDGLFKTFEFPKKFEGVEIWDIEEQQDGSLVLLSYERSLLQFKGRVFSEFDFKIDNKPNYKADLLIEESGEIVLAGEGGLIFIDGSKVDTLHAIGEGYWEKYVNIVYKDQDGIYWLGTEKGIIEYKNGVQTRYAKKQGVEGSSVYEIKEDELGNIWFGTNKGITAFTKLKDPENPYSIRTFETDKNYLTETMFIQFDNWGGLWQGTNAGLNYYNLHDWDETGKTKSIHFALQDYGRGIEFNGSASLIDDNGNLWFGTAQNGVVKYNFPRSSRVIKLDEPPSLFFNSIYVNGDQLEVGHSYENQIGLSYNENNIEIDFGVLNYKDPDRVMFKHRLNGFDEQFLSDGDDNTRLYTNLKPGEYTFEVFAKSPSSDWNEEPLVFQFMIKKPYWMQLWFVGLVILAVVIAFYLIVKFRVAYLEKKKLKDLVEGQTKELKGALEEKEVLIKEIHHRVKNNLAVISGLLEMQSWSLENEEAQKALNESKLRVLAIAKIHENLYQNKNLGKINFEKFLIELRNGIVTAMQIEGKNIAVELKVNSELIRLDQAIPCGLIINELLTNSYKHAFVDKNEGTIQVFFHTFEKHHQIIVQDDGVGAPDDILQSENTSLGITLIGSLVTQLDSEITYQYKDGARFEITIPRKELAEII